MDGNFAPAAEAQEPKTADEKPAEKPVDTPTPKSEASDKPAESAPAKEEKPADIDPLDELLTPPADEPQALDDATKGTIAKFLGVDDPIKFKEEVSVLREQVSQFKEKAEQYDAVFDRISKMPYELSKAVQAAANGEDYKPMLEKLSRGISLSKESKDIDKVALVNEHFPGKFSEEDLEAIKDGDKSLGAAFDKFHELAAMKHDEARQSEVAKQREFIEQQKAIKEAHQKADAAAVAHFKQQGALAKLADPNIINDFLSGKLEESTLYNADGTKKPEYLTLLAKAMTFDKLVARAREGAKVSGGDERELALRGRMPEQPKSPNGDRSQPPQAKSDKQKAEELVQQAFAEALSM
jgi:hypothetical protein